MHIHNQLAAAKRLSHGGRVKVISGLLVVLLASYCCFAQTKTNLPPFEFTSQPVLLENKEHYRIIWSTTQIGSAKVVVKQNDGSQKTFSDATDGVGDFQTRIHRVDVPKALLEAAGATYSVSSRRSIDTSRYGYQLGEEIVSARHAVAVQRPADNIAFLAISDVQGGAKLARTVLERVDEPYNFVLLLGDFSNDYNSADDYIEPLLCLAYQASKGAIPCLYVSGNHEIKGTWSRLTNQIFPTPSPDNQRYFTYSFGPLFITALFLGDDHSDDMPRYSGVSEFDAYKDRQFDWLAGTVLPKQEWKQFRYNIAVAHIPLIRANNDLTVSHFCKECNKAHGYKLPEFAAAFNNTIKPQLMVSGHTHQAQLVSDPSLSFPNLQTGGHLGRNKFYHTSLVRFVNDTISYTVYDSTGKKTTYPILPPSR
ncbi:MAG: metallophosphoesterase [Kiritimatiellaeota bacterium]|nr:metallophosphoesterase [Kiritimatiellota bacterium]